MEVEWRDGVTIALACNCDDVALAELSEQGFTLKQS